MNCGGQQPWVVDGSAWLYGHDGNWSLDDLGGGLESPKKVPSLHAGCISLLMHLGETGLETLVSTLTP